MLTKKQIKALQLEGFTFGETQFVDTDLTHSWLHPTKDLCIFPARMSMWPADEMKRNRMQYHLVDDVEPATESVCITVSARSIARYLF